ncbi:hypothetical protein AM493_12255 [Flavobacterium akiainvivens]|uniref:TraB/GumN family protein n=3 Tax=Flavobacterium akiainvivens TaxID=1202724 RepID=A0A0M9VIH7_9FLAO|nr:TraB/GumN family protein [Flavobacterium akiainvivens]KOS06716.1 hypothetical protein AM493_12255 [Flavobacterium akiainvivens]
MKRLVLLLLLSATSLFAQEKKYQGLLWEVSGNGLNKNSYLYGSMHVSDKVSYHLSDAFFTHLLNADMVANESEPSTWMDLMGLMGRGPFRGKLYASFYMQPTAKTDLYPLFRSKDYTINHLLFRTNSYQEEYQEDTYLDMFIYRTGRKYGKKTVGLEDTKTSMLNIMNIPFKDARPSEENMVAIQKLLKDTDYEEAMMNYYRDKDLDMLDSLTNLSSGEKYLKVMLWDRNTVMVKSIDSLMRTGSLFAAVGAAHLPGKHGIIEMLRTKGYTVKAVPATYTDKGKADKEKIDNYFTKPKFKTYTSPDGVVSLPVIDGPVIEIETDVQSPDLANGGYINVKRLLLNDYLKKDYKAFNPLSLDSLFYENIPGKILEKKFSTADGYKLYDIKSVTKTGNAQRYRYYITPMEIIMVSMAGEKNYVRQFENDVFNNLKIKVNGTAWVKTGPQRGGFTINMPGYYVATGEKTNAKVTEDVSFYGYDAATRANFFVEERTIGDNEALEDTAFELRRMHTEFYTQLGIDSTHVQVDATKTTYTSSASLTERGLRLKSVINGPKYFLIGSIGATEAAADSFINSFALTPVKDATDYKVFKDTIGLYSVQIARAQNERLDFEPANRSRYGYDDEEKNVFKELYGNRQFSMPNGQVVDVYYHKYHRHTSIKSIDSIWGKLKKYMLEEDNLANIDNDAMAVATDSIAAIPGFSMGDYTVKLGSIWDKYIKPKKAKLQLIDEKQEFVESGKYYQYTATLISDRSQQAIKVKALHRNGTTYVINTLVEKGYKSGDPAIEKLFNSFTLLNDPKAEDLPADRFKLWMEDAQSEHDSIRSSALASISSLELTKEDSKALENFIDNFEFEAEETEALVELYAKLGRLKDESSIPFFERQYKQEDVNATVQFAVLDALTNYESKAAYKKIGELMEFDLPISDNSYEVQSLFSSFENDAKNSAVLFPDVLQYYSIPEYQGPVVSFASTLIEEKEVKAKKLKAYKKMLLTSTRLEIKRAKSRKALQQMSGDDYEYAYAYNDDEPASLTGYMQLLYAFRNDKDVKKVFDAIATLDMDETNLELARLEIKNGDANEEKLKGLLADNKTRFEILKLLTEKKETGLLKEFSDEEIAESAIISLEGVDTKKDSLIFIESRSVNYDEKNIITFYFYKTKNIEKKDKNDYD